MALDLRQGIETNWQITGTGGRPALAIHCMLGSARMWEPVLTPLGDRLRSTAFDLPGHGHSAPWPRDDTPGAYQALATRIAASFIDRPLDLIGHSFGAVVALRIAAAAPEAVRTLTLVEPVLFRAAQGTPDWQIWHDRQLAFNALCAAGDYEAATRDFMGKWGAGTPWDTISEKRRVRFIAQMPIVADVSSSNYTDPGHIWREGALETIDAPVMIVKGGDSPTIMTEVCEGIAARLGDVGLAEIPGAGHMIPVTHPAPLTELIAANLDRA